MRQGPAEPGAQRRLRLDQPLLLRRQRRQFRPRRVEVVLAATTPWRAFRRPPAGRPRRRGPGSAHRPRPPSASGPAGRRCRRRPAPRGPAGTATSRVQRHGRTNHRTSHLQSGLELLLPLLREEARVVEDRVRRRCRPAGRARTRSRQMRRTHPGRRSARPPRRRACPRRRPAASWLVPADLSASIVALSWSWVAERMSCAWFVVFSAPRTVVALIRRAARRAASSAAPAAAPASGGPARRRSWRSPGPAVTGWPTCTSPFSWPTRSTRGSARFRVKRAERRHRVVTFPRSTHAVVGAGGADDVEQAPSRAASGARGAVARAAVGTCRSGVEQERGDPGLRTMTAGLHLGADVLLDERDRAHAPPAPARRG